MTAIAGLAGALRDFALPARCPGCGAIVEGDGRFCLGCWQGLDFLSGEGCSSCHRPLPVAGLVCARCLAEPPAHDGVHAAVAYGETARAVVLKLKYGGRTAMAEIIAEQLARHVRSAPGGLLVPVPLHRWRLWSRGYNQSALIARALRRRTGADLALDALVRVKATPLLRGLGRARRAEAVRGAFRVSDRRQVEGRDIWLVDDVFTSGATANACARVLKRGGAASVTLLCWARVLGPDED